VVDSAIDVYPETREVMKRIIALLIGLAIPAAVFALVGRADAPPNEAGNCYYVENNHYRPFAPGDRKPSYSSSPEVAASAQGNMRTTDSDVRRTDRTPGTVEFTRADSEGNLEKRVTVINNGGEWRVSEKKVRIPCNLRPASNDGDIGQQLLENGIDPHKL
jgi:hypothetical protein